MIFRRMTSLQHRIPRAFSRTSVMATFSLLLLFGLTARAQQQPDSTVPGVIWGDYRVTQTTQLGERVVGTSGDESTYRTFVDFHSGPRLLEHALELHSLDHHGLLFDTLALDGLGYGDPNTSARLRVSKDLRYDFAASFRRDRNFWDYNLLANPLNLAGAPAIFVQSHSPHRFDFTRQMSDSSLMLLPQSKVRFRLGYSRGNSDGPSFSSMNEGTRQGFQFGLAQPWRSLSDSIRIGIDIKPLPRTSVSIDHIWQRQRGDTAWLDAGPNALLPGGAPVDLGLVFDPAFQSCSPLLSSGLANPDCNAVLSYSRSAPFRSSSPTGQLSAQSSYFRRLDLSARFVYSSADSRADHLAERFLGFLSGTGDRDVTITGGSLARRIALTADLGATWRITEALRLSENLQHAQFRIPGDSSSLTTSLFGASLLDSPRAFDPATCPPPFTAAACPHHSFTSGPDVESDRFTTYLGQRSTTSLLQLEYDFGKRWSARIGHRYRQRTITHRFDSRSDQSFFPDLSFRAGCFAPDAAGVCRTAVTSSLSDAAHINQHSALLGFSFRQHDLLRIDFDANVTSADKVYHRTGPRLLKQFRLRANAHPGDRLDFAASLNILDQQNDLPQVSSFQHSRNFTAGAQLRNKTSRWMFDLDYDYLDLDGRVTICFASTLPVAGSQPCVLSPGLLQATSFQQTASHFARAAVLWKLHPRLTVELAENLSSVDGSALLLDRNMPLGPLANTYQRPSAAVSVVLNRHFTWKTAWDYYGYAERGDPGSIPVRNFHANILLLSLRHTL